MKKLLLVSLIFLIEINFVFGLDLSQQSNKILINPYYTATFTKNINYNFNITINPPDKITNILSAIINFNLFATSSPQEFILTVNGHSCRNPSYIALSSGFATTSFDCTNIITKAGYYNMTMTSVKDSGGLTGWLDLTYINNASDYVGRVGNVTNVNMVDNVDKVSSVDKINQGNLLMHGTEYSPGQNAKLWLQLLDSNKSAVINAVCYIDVFKPDGTELVTHAAMSNQHVQGIYYYNLLAPYIQGIYPSIADCYFIASQNPRVVTSYNITSGVLKGAGTIANAQTLDGTYLVFTTSKNAGTVNNRINITFGFSDFYTNCGNVSEALLTGLTFSWTGIWNTGNVNHNIVLYTYNYTGKNWITLSNIIDGGNGNTVLTVANSLPTVNTTKLLGINSSNPLLLRVIDTDINEGGKDLSTDYLYASCDQLANPQYEEVKGSSELHVSSSLTNIPVSGTMNIIPSITFPDINLTYYTGIFVSNFTVQSVTYLSQFETISYSPFDALPCNVYQYLYRIETNGSLTSLLFSTQWDTANSRCNINFQQTLDPAINYYFTVFGRNTWESDMRSSYSGFGTIYPLVSAGCDLWATQNNETPYPYVVPKNATTSNSYFYLACSDYYDDYYWLNSTYQKALSDKTNIVNWNSFLSYEADYYSYKTAEQKLNTVSNLLMNDLSSAAEYSNVISLDPLNRSNMIGQRFWANYSTLQVLYLLNTKMNNTIAIINQSTFFTNTYIANNFTYTFGLIGNVNNTLYTELLIVDGHLISINQTLPGAAWSYNNRTLTNYSEGTIANAIWNYSGTIADNILTQIANKLFEFIGGVAQVI